MAKQPKPKNQPKENPAQEVVQRFLQQQHKTKSSERQEECRKIKQQNFAPSTIFLRLQAKPYRVITFSWINAVGWVPWTGL
jgi:hypothetical protein